MKKMVLSQKPTLEILFEFGKRFAGRARHQIKSAERILTPIQNKLGLPRE